ncbi:hypothetical protein Mgra_00005713 [Meloidogyne graminicola]|uniref:CWH43-like N-terminal domain-containing protein n=1 Tax=Meloidogyne graminicola TaxID=189291 RepID=A0A8S9ZN22_9BILA|nr:hypothetical protein Mgra_00005713 [Meloidogyne graminicola]
MEIEKTLNSDNEKSVNKNKFFVRLRLHRLCMIGALLPGIGCYTCLLYTFIFQRERLNNFATTNCPNVHSSFPPVSYSIGVWEPQKYIWLFVLLFHVPARLFFGVAYKANFDLGVSEFKQRSWYIPMLKLHMFFLFSEIIGLVLVSIVDIEGHFVFHAIGYALWLISFNLNMCFNTILFYHSGIHSIWRNLDIILRLKCIFAYLIIYPLSISTGFTYFDYTLFSLAEYALVGFNSFWYFLLLWEMEKSEIEIYLN